MRLIKLLTESGVSDFKYVGKICPPPIRIGYVIPRICSGCKRIVSGILWKISEFMLHKNV